jgi:hypothetical protein
MVVFSSLRLARPSHGVGAAAPRSMSAMLPIMSILLPGAAYGASSPPIAVTL